MIRTNDTHKWYAENDTHKPYAQIIRTISYAQGRLSSGKFRTDPQPPAHNKQPLFMIEQAIIYYWMSSIIISNKM